MVVNVQQPDLPPTHQITVKVDARNASFANLPKPIKLTASGLANDTRVTLVQLPPVTVPKMPPVFTIDLRHNFTAFPLKQNASARPDLKVVQIALPQIPKLGRDVNITLPTINLDRYMPAKPADSGALNLTVSVVNATLPSLNRIPALNKPLIKPGNFTVGFKGKPTNAAMGKGNWGVQVTVEDVMSGGSPVTPLQFGGPLPESSVIKIVKDAVVSVFDEKAGQFCHTKCCPACKPQPVKIEYAQPIVSCAAGCDLVDPTAGQCVCKAAAAAPCPAGKKECAYAPGHPSICIDEKSNAMCVPHGAVCVATGKVDTCPAA